MLPPTPSSSPQSHALDPKAHDCPDASTLAAWCDGLVADDECEALDVHISSCQLCAELMTAIAPTKSAASDIAPLALARSIERACSLVESRTPWRFVASGMAAALAFAALGGWMGIRLAKASQHPSGADHLIQGSASDLTTASLSYGLFDETDAATFGTDPLELIALPLTERSPS
jgi:hypothetical protein